MTTSSLPHATPLSEASRTGEGKETVGTGVWGLDGIERCATREPGGGSRARCRNIQAVFAVRKSGLGITTSDMLLSSGGEGERMQEPSRIFQSVARPPPIAIAISSIPDQGQLLFAQNRFPGLIRLSLFAPI